MPVTTLEPEHPFGPCAGKGALMWQEGQSAVVPCAVSSPSQLFPPDQGIAGDGRHPHEQVSEQVHRRGSVSGLLQLGSPTGVGP